MASSRSIGSLTVDLLLKYAGFEQGLDKAARTAKAKSKEIETGFTSAFKSVGAAVSGFVAGLATVQSAIAGFNTAVDAADRLDELSARYDISTEKLSALGYAAKMTGGDLESLAGVIPKFSKNVAEAADASSKMGETFAALGVSVKDSNGNLRTFEDLLPEIADKFRSLDDSTTETALAMQLFGRSGAEFLEFLNLGSEGLQTMEERARDLGIVIDTETASKAAQFKDRVDDLRAATQGWFTQIAAELLPTLTDLTQELTKFVKDGGNAVTIADSLAQSIRDIADAIKFLGSLAGVFDSIRGGLAGLELQGNAAFQSLNPANWNPEDLARLEEQYKKGAEYVENGWKAMQEADQKGRRAFEEDGKRRVRGGQLQGAASRDQFIDKALADRLAGFFEDPGGDKATAAAKEAARLAKEAEREADRLQKAINKMTDAQRKWTTELDGTGNPILDQYAQRLDEISSSAEEFERLNVPQERIKSFTEDMKRLAVAIKDKELSDFRREFVWDTKELANSLDGASSAAIAYERALFALDKQLKQGLITQEQYDARVAKEQERRHSDATTLLRDMQFEIKLMGLSNAARQTAIQLRGMDAESVKKYGDEIAATNQKIYEDMQKIEIMDGFRDGFSNFFQDVISGTSSVSDAFKNMLDDINRMILQRIADNWVEQLFGAMGTNQGGSAGGDWLSMFAGLFGGGRANGGWAAANSVYEVNERGLEMATVNGRNYMLTGNSPVQVTPNHMLGGSGVSQVNNFNVVGRIDRRTQDQIAQEVGRKASVAARRNG